MPANRVAALGAALSAAVGAVVTLLGAVPAAWQGPVLIAVVVCVTVLAVVFMVGSWKHTPTKTLFIPPGTYTPPSGGIYVGATTSNVSGNVIQEPVADEPPPLNAKPEPPPSESA